MTQDKVTRAYFPPQFHHNNEVTSETSKARGTTLNTSADRTKLMPRLPRSMALERAPRESEKMKRSRIIIE